MTYHALTSYPAYSPCDGGNSVSLHPCGLWKVYSPCDGGNSWIHENHLYIETYSPCAGGNSMSLEQLETLVNYYPCDGGGVIPHGTGNNERAHPIPRVTGVILNRCRCAFRRSDIPHITGVNPQS